MITFPVPPGLCATCRWMRPVPTRAGASFVLCRKSETDPWFPKYPSLPVRACDGYIENSAPPGPQSP